ncbi:chitin synthase-domain-containing protein [Blastocladiella britannica]|nr:chitin synthase-domain-containing protein [Blastocladiella britannica]
MSYRGNPSAEERRQAAAAAAAASSAPTLAPIVTQPNLADLAVASPSLVSAGQDRFASGVSTSAQSAQSPAVQRRGRNTPVGGKTDGNNLQDPVKPRPNSVSIGQGLAISLGTPTGEKPASPRSNHTTHSTDVFYQYDPVTGDFIDHTGNAALQDPGPSGMILVDRQPTLGPRLKPKHLVRKRSTRQAQSPGAASGGAGASSITAVPAMPPMVGKGGATAIQNFPLPSPSMSVPSLTLADRARVVAASLPGAPPSFRSTATMMAPGGARWWLIMSNTMTFWAPSFILKRTISPDPSVQQAWREKVALCMLIALVGGAVAFLTLGLTRTICGSGATEPIIEYDQVSSTLKKGFFVIRGEIYDVSKITGVVHGGAKARGFSAVNAATRDAFGAIPGGTDVTALFPDPSATAACSAVAVKATSLKCSTSMYPAVPYCHDYAAFSAASSAAYYGKVAYPWTTLTDSKSMFVYNGHIIDLAAYLKAGVHVYGDEMHAELLSIVGTDASMRLERNAKTRQLATCLAGMYTVGLVDLSTPGCIASNIILYMSLVVILGLVMTRFIVAVIFDWFLSWKLGKLQTSRALYDRLTRRRFNRKSIFFRKGTDVPPSSATATPRSSVVAPDQEAAADVAAAYSANPNEPSPDALRPYYTVILVTCYSESEAELKKTLDSVAETSYPDDQKLLFVVADGIITGKGNEKSTPDTVLGMLDEVAIGPCDPVSYVAIADGAKRHNKARVHVGWYHSNDHRVPMIVVVKCGNDDEQDKPKAGNRGKRDGQIILMDFWSRLNLGEHLSPLQFDMFYKLHALTGVNPIQYEIILMVDADTKLLQDSLPRMVAAMADDGAIMGLCGETRIDNKNQSWVSRIQVFEYYISHHLGKAFESVFGGVTCLPGCFCMYRIVSQRPDGLRVPILCSPAIVASYSENVVDTLHKKNLLSLGEDRFLSTLMLRNFPKRKMMFVPKALCRTVVPHTLSMLLSQRRRWINSTIHNLLELVLVRQLCGTWCFSMQFVVLMELLGTVSLPVAITMTYYLIVSAFTSSDVQWIPLIMLIAILGLPAVLIMLTTRKLVYVYWMMVFLLSLPVWNFLLPVYAFWHFDDFSWGATRVVTGEHTQHDHSKKDGEFDAAQVPFLSLGNWMQLINSMAAAKGGASGKTAPVSDAAANGRVGGGGAQSVQAVVLPPEFVVEDANARRQSNRTSRSAALGAVVPGLPSTQNGN